MEDNEKERLKRIKVIIDKLEALGVPQLTIEGLKVWLVKGAPKWS
jgi:hypothetical protein